MQRTKDVPGYEIFRVKGWDYPSLCETYEKAIKLCREEHVPVMIHVSEVNQPQGHSTSGSHERYKSKERLQWEKDFDCIEKFKAFIIDADIASTDELEQIEKDAKKHVSAEKRAAWTEFEADLKAELNTVLPLLEEIVSASSNGSICQADV